MFVDLPRSERMKVNDGVEGLPAVLRGRIRSATTEIGHQRLQRLVLDPLLHRTEIVASGKARARSFVQLA